MEEFTMTAIQVFTSYGAMGGCLIYFIFKDMVLNKAMTDALSKFTLAINLMTDGKVGE